MDNFEIDKPERIIRRHGAASKPKNKLGFYLYMSAGFIILVALLTAIWLLLKDPEIPQSAIYSNSSNEPDILAAETNGVSVPLNINTQSISETTNEGTGISQEIQIPVENEIELTPINTTSSASTTTNEVTQSQGAISSLPLDYALAGSKPITKSNSANQSLETALSLESAKIDLNNKTSNASQTITQQPSVEAPKTEKVIQTTNIVQNQLNNAAVQLTPQTPSEDLSKVAPQTSTERTNTPPPSSSKNNPGLIESAKAPTKVQPAQESIVSQTSTDYTNVPPPANNKNNPGVIEPAKTQAKVQPAQENVISQASTDYTNAPPPAKSKNNPGVIESASLKTNESQLTSSQAIVPTQKSLEPIKQSQPQNPVEATNQQKTVTPQTAVINNSIPEGQTIPRPAAPNTITTPVNNPTVQESAKSLQSQEKQTTSQETSSQIKTNQSNQISNTNQRIDNGRGGNISIQVASASRPEGLRKLAVEQNLTTGRVIETERNGSKWYILVTGHYASRNEAQRAISTLPAPLQKNNPWVREAP
ncbi:SPOR domain-containing protein [Thorsellia anophelis]|uniref:Sporulation related domain-containing protein n=1 Tax=Thorsellia anophelis DSM 18579 TaxID=1123402 RepID=A0A1H9Y4T9_9GAMM|nr:SPOR domain-containing protein [Thorsellia anophelis]SES63890.1 Sporulation related domain-containing protein [Thorsellia anophelis DSM 18579]